MRNGKFFLFAIAAHFMLSACAVNNTGAVRIYQGLVFDNVEGAHYKPYLQSLIIDESNSLVSYGKNVKMLLKDCGTSGWHCLSDGNIEFAIMDKWTSSIRNWTYGNFRYSVIENLDVKSGVIYILAEQKNELKSGLPPNVYLYSKTKGLVGIITHFSGMREELLPVVYLRLK